MSDIRKYQQYRPELSDWEKMEILRADARAVLWEFQDDLVTRHSIFPHGETHAKRRSDTRSTAQQSVDPVGLECV